MNGFRSFQAGLATRSRLLAVVLLLVSAAVWPAGFLPDRREAAPPSPPYLALARVIADGGVGCGVLVGPDLLLTCAHVVCFPDGRRHTDIVVELGVGFPLGERTARPLEIISPFTGQDDPASGKDWALVRLDRPLGLLYGWLPCKTMKDGDWKQATVELAGFCHCPDDLRPEFNDMKKAYRCPCEVRDVGPSILFHTGAMWGGTSGAPMLAQWDGQYYVVGLNSAGVDIQGEVLEHGFRATYAKETANIAVPARQWSTQLSELAQRKPSKLRSFWVRNGYSYPLQVCVRYRNVFSEPGQPYSITPWKEIAPQKRLSILENASGCEDDEIYISLRKVNGQQVGPAHPLEFEVDGEGRKFFRKSLVGASDYTARFP